MCQTFALPIIVHVIFVQWGQLTCATRSYPIAISHHFRLIYLARVPHIPPMQDFVSLQLSENFHLSYIVCLRLPRSIILSFKLCSRFLLLVPSTGVIHIFLCFTANRVIWHYQQWLLSPQQ